MRAPVLVELTVAGLLCVHTAAGVEPDAPKSEGTTVDAALSEPADRDDEADIRADDDPNDVGQEALEPSEDAPQPDSSAEDGEMGSD